MLKKYFDLISKERVYLFKIKDNVNVENIMALASCFVGNEKYIRFGKLSHSANVEIWTDKNNYFCFHPYDDRAIQLENMFRDDFNL